MDPQPFFQSSCSFVAVHTEYSHTCVCKWLLKKGRNFVATLKKQTWRGYATSLIVFRVVKGLACVVVQHSNKSYHSLAFRSRIYYAKRIFGRGFSDLHTHSRKCSECSKCFGVLCIKQARSTFFSCLRTKRFFLVMFRIFLRMNVQFPATSFNALIDILPRTISILKLFSSTTIFIVSLHLLVLRRPKFIPPTSTSSRIWTERGFLPVYDC